MQWVAVCAGPSKPHLKSIKFVINFFPMKFKKITKEIFPELLNHQHIKYMFGTEKDYDSFV